MIQFSIGAFLCCTHNVGRFRWKWCFYFFISSISRRYILIANRIGTSTQPPCSPVGCKCRNIAVQRSTYTKTTKTISDRNLLQFMKMKKTSYSSGPSSQTRNSIFLIIKKCRRNEFPLHFYFYIVRQLSRRARISAFL